jgi:hypothetical protein
MVAVGLPASALWAVRLPEAVIEPLGALGAGGGGGVVGPLRPAVALPTFE